MALRTQVRIHSEAKMFHKVTSTRRAVNPYRIIWAHIPSDVTIITKHPLIGETRMVHYFFLCKLIKIYRIQTENHGKSMMKIRYAKK